MQTYGEPVSSFPASMASFAVRLMSLNAYELRCLNQDNELMRHLNETQLLMESRLQDLHNSAGGAGAHADTVVQLTGARQDKYVHQHQHQTQMQQLNHNHHHHQTHSQHSPASSPIQLNLGQAHHQAHEQLSQHQLLLSPNSYYNNYYAQQLALANQVAQMHHHHHQQQQQQQQLNHQQQYLLLLARNQNHNQNNHNTSSHHNVNATQNLAYPTTHNSQTIGSQLGRPTGAPPVELATGATGALVGQQLDGAPSAQPALDLRTTPTRPMSALSASPSPVGRAGSTGSGRSLAAVQHPKKVKLSEYRMMQQLAERGNNVINNNQQQQQQQQQQQHNKEANSNNNDDTKSHRLSAAEVDEFHDQNRRPPRGGHKPKLEELQNTTNNKTSKQQQLQANKNCSLTPQINGSIATPVTITSNKKYKGEFDEPTPTEIAQREHELDRPHHYHRQALERGECACVLGSEFRDKTGRDVLEMIEQWRSMDVEQRVKWKWDVNDLPKDIPLSDIKKFEDLRREFSEGRADFGGASKRKPLGIRGTRQFLLILYCLWGHPGRDDPMQRDGYCPHCFAKIKKANEQSTLVRVVNHFNMKHRRGANPRLSPQLENPANSNNNNASSWPQNNSNGQVRDTLISVVEAAAAAAASTSAGSGQPARQMDDQCQDSNKRHQDRATTTKEPPLQQSTRSQPTADSSSGESVGESRVEVGERAQ